MPFFIPPPPFFLCPNGVGGLGAPGLGGWWGVCVGGGILSGTAPLSFPHKPSFAHVLSTLFPFLENRPFSDSPLRSFPRRLGGVGVAFVDSFPFPPSSNFFFLQELCLWHVWLCGSTYPSRETPPPPPTPLSSKLPFRLAFCSRALPISTTGLRSGLGIVAFVCGQP